MRIRSTTGAGLVAALVLGLGLPTYGVPNGADPGDPPRAHLPAAASDRAHEALAHAQAILDGDRTTSARAQAPHPTRDATLALRDLMEVRGQLTGADRQQADRLLARPAANRKTCVRRICVHWNPASVRPRDDDANNIPDYIDGVAATVDGVHQRYVAAGYRAPRPDGGRGGDNRTDIYIRDVGSRGIYGFCTSDKQVRPAGPFDAWAYCVLDNDYRRGQFPNLTPLENMQVTAAHEYYHAVQFAYDAFEDGWFMEATATWAEDEIFDDINDNVQYLRAGPLHRPRIPLDKFVGLHHYGDWIFFRYLTERFPDGIGMPVVVRQIWQRADGSAGARDMYSMQAVRAILASRGTSFERTFARFADANRRPAEVYAEGADNGYPRAPLAGSRNLGPRDSSGWLARVLDHQSSATLRFVPRGLTGAAWRLRVNVDLAARFRGSLAVVTEHPVGRPAVTSLMTLDRTGAGVTRVPFVDGQVASVEVTLVNASTRSRCWVSQFSAYSCLGVPRDDNLTQRIRATVVR